jgi:soluble lytic murein transglycosylase-like protein
MITYEHAHPSLKMYYCLKKYSKMYNIPEGYAFSIAYHETKYQGPFHSNYNWSRESTAGAVGPMQIIPKYGKIYAKKYLNKNITIDELNEDIELNVQLSMLMLRDWVKMSKGNWKLAFGGYNTGKLMINQYALNVYNKDYVWLKN